MVDSIYGVIKYNEGKYGQQPRLTLSAGSFGALSMDYSSALIAWGEITGSTAENFIGIRLVRNYDQFPEGPEDGVILLENYLAAGNPSLTPTGVKYFRDTNLSSGRYVYYRIWVLMDEAFVDAPNEWFAIGDAAVLIPMAHTSRTLSSTVEFRSRLDSNGVPTGELYEKRVPSKELQSTHEKFLGYLPRFYFQDVNLIRPNQRNKDETGEFSTLSKFLEAFSFGFDEMLTYADLVIPDASGRKTAPTILGLQAFQLGLPQDIEQVSRSQKRLVRNAIYIYSRKGTHKAFQSFVESLTGFDSAITTRDNQMLSLQDATFYNGTGFWVESPARAVDGTGPILLTATKATSPMTVATGDLVFDTEWVGQAVVSSAGAKMSLGFDKPITKGIPVASATSYKFRFNHKAGGTITNNSFVIRWYSAAGVQLSTTTESLSMTTSWAKKEVTVTSPTGAARASIEIVFNTTGTYYVDRFTVSLAAVTNYYEPRMVDVFLQPSKINYMPNPSLEVDTDYWSNNITRLDTTDLPTNAGINTPNDLLTSDWVGTTTLTGSGTTYTAEVTNFLNLTDVKPPAGGPVSASMFASTETGASISFLLTAEKRVTPVSIVRTDGVLTINFASPHGYTLNQTIDKLVISDSWASAKDIVLIEGFVVSKMTPTSISTTAVGSSGSTDDFDLHTVTAGYVRTNVSALDSGIKNIYTNVWDRQSASIYVPEYFGTDDGYTLTATMYFQSTEAAVVYVEGAQIEASSKPTDYFDGDLNIPGVTWAGTAHASISYKYTNIVSRLRKLQGEIMQYLPIGSVYQVRNYWVDQTIAIS